MRKRKPLPKRRPPVPAAPTPEQIARIDEALRQLEAVGLIERDREAEKEDGQLHIRLTHPRPLKR